MSVHFLLELQRPLTQNVADGELDQVEYRADQVLTGSRTEGENLEKHVGRLGELGIDPRFRQVVVTLDAPVIFAMQATNGFEADNDQEDLYANAQVIVSGGLKILLREQVVSTYTQQRADVLTDRLDMPLIRENACIDRVPIKQHAKRM